MGMLELGEKREKPRLFKYFEKHRAEHMTKERRLQVVRKCGLSYQVGQPTRHSISPERVPDQWRIFDNECG